MKVAARAKDRKTFKQYFLLGQLPNFKMISQKCSLGEWGMGTLEGYSAILTKGNSFNVFLCSYILGFPWKKDIA